MISRNIRALTEENRPSIWSSLQNSRVKTRSQFSCLLLKVIEDEIMVSSYHVNGLLYCVSNLDVLSALLTIAFLLSVIIIKYYSKG